METPTGRWTAVSARGLDLVPDSTLTLTFGDGRVSAYAGCNRMSAQGGFEGSAVRLTGPLISTMMFCEGVMEQERWLATLLEAAPDWELDGDALVLTSADHSLTLRPDTADSADSENVDADPGTDEGPVDPVVG